jgi:hypothetical protein
MVLSIRSLIYVLGEPRALGCRRTCRSGVAFRDRTLSEFKKLPRPACPDCDPIKAMHTERASQSWAVIVLHWSEKSYDEIWARLSIIVY